MKQGEWFCATDYYNNKESEDNIRVCKENLMRDIPLHKHDDIETMYVFSGSGKIFVNGIEYPLSRGSFINLNPYHFYGISTREGLGLYTCVYPVALPILTQVYPVPAESLSDLLYEGHPVVQCTSEQQEIIEQLFERLLVEFNEKDLFYEKSVSNMILQLSVYYSRFSLKNVYDGEKLEPPVEWLALQKIMLTPYQTITLEEVANEYKVSPEYLNRKLRAVTGKSFKQNINYTKIINACSLMHFPELSIQYIANLLCYTSMNTFYREFKKYKGMTPDEYRKKEISQQDTFIMPNQDVGLQLLIYLHMHYKEPLTLSSIAKQFNMSESFIQKVCKGCFGKSLTDTLNEIRISYAIPLLCATKLTIYDIALSVGFESISTFNRVFKKITYQTAGEYREDFCKQEKCF